MTSNHRELIEMAAKACGIEGSWYSADMHPQGEEGISRSFMVPIWNPITNSGQCADMEAQLGIDVIWAVKGIQSQGNADAVYELYSDHPTRQAARMMASTRAAAEIQRRKEGK